MHDVMKVGTDRKHRESTAVVNVLVWIIILCLPYLAYTSGVRIEKFTDYILLLRLPVTVMAVYYVNYYLLVEKFLTRQKSWFFVCCNIILISLVNFFESATAVPLSAAPPVPDSIAPPVPEFGGIGFRPFHFLFVNTLLYVCAIGTAIVFRIIRRWYENEKRRKEQEHSHVRIELQNLKNQLNPHFLFNALNNIYSFIGSDSDHARRSLDSLCELLRYALYRSDRPEVYFREEVSFIRNYIDLAGERLPDDTDLSVELPDPGSETLIAPMLFIVPVENAFKHGVRSGKSSFIHIVLKENDGRIICKVENTCYPDYDSRESRDTGIGLENLHRRLDILYDGHYTFQYGVTDNEKYYSYLEIETM